MGYWSSHPMAGDEPLEAKDELDCLLFTEEELDEELYKNEDIYRERILAHLEDAISLDYPNNQRFVLPYVIVDLQIQIKDKRLSDAVKEMIGDGGNMLRGYPPVQPVDKDYRIHYNHFKTPLDHANYLRDIWDDLMEGNIPFSVVKEKCNFIDILLFQNM